MRKELQALIAAIIIGGLVYYGFYLRDQDDPPPQIPMEDFFKNPT
ncbi:MAG: hypothetical protein SCARUB_04530, partial [Candidatus Scalindua rubra]